MEDRLSRLGDRRRYRPRLFSFQCLHLENEQLGMNSQHTRFRIWQLLFAVFVASTLLATIPLGWFAVFLLAVIWCAVIVNVKSRFKHGNRKVVAGFHGMCAAVVFAGCLTACYGCWSTASVFGLMFAIGGFGIGLIAGMIPTLLLALIPESKIQYYGERNPPHNSIVASVVAYIASGP